MQKNTEIFEKAKMCLVGGACAGGRTNRVLGHPVYMSHADGSHLYSVDGDDYIDYHVGSAAIMFGYNNPRIKNAILECVDKGFYMNFDSEYTLKFAELFTNFIPTVEKIRLTNSGTEATLAAIRLARAYTGKNLIIKMNGHFHGMHEMIWFNSKNYSTLDEFGEAPMSVPDTVGFPEGIGEHVKVIDFNNIDAVKHAVEKYKNKIAAIIMEPVNYDCGCVPSTKEYMKQVREICTKNEILLIYDEVISGLRFRPGSAQTYYGVQPDISTFGKAIANGFSLGLIGGKSEIMDTFNPLGAVVCSGTSSGNLMAVMAGIECLKMAAEPGFYQKIESIEETLCGGINDLFSKHSLPGHVRSHGAQFGIYFGYDNPEIDFDLQKTISLFDTAMYRKFVTECLKEKLYFHYMGDIPFPHHVGFTSAHTENDISLSLERIDRVFAKLK